MPPIVLSLGCGVQSSTLLLMADVGELPRPDIALFADTQDEPEAVYEYLQYLRSSCQHIPIEVVSAGRLSESILLREGNRISIPAYGDRGGMKKRQCTDRYKIRPIQRRIRELWPSGEVTVWIGISFDEVHRMRPSHVKRFHNEWPLVDLGMRRYECIEWMTSRGYKEPPKSACVFCPYHNSAGWRSVLANEQDRSRMEAVEARMNEDGFYLHASRRKIADVDLATKEELGQMSLFGNDCSGMCGV